MTKEEAIIQLRLGPGINEDVSEKYNDAVNIAIEALSQPIVWQEWDEVVFDMNEFFSIVDDGKITVMRRGKGRVTVERPAMMGMGTTICSYGEGRDE